MKGGSASSCHCTRVTESAISHSFFIVVDVPLSHHLVISIFATTLLLLLLVAYLRQSIGPHIHCQMDDFTEDEQTLDCDF